jgi:hypothetical protein
MNEDPMLREHFARLRRAEQASTPGFERILALAGHRSSRISPALAMAASVALAAVALVIVRLPSPHRSPTIEAVAPMLADWHSPTDFLLDTPGRELLDTIPEIGRSPLTRFGPFPPTPMTTPARRAGREHS